MKSSLSNQEILTEVEQIISSGKTVELKVEGGSMRPYLRSKKDIIVLSAFQPDELRRGAIVLFRYHNNPIFHRIIKIDNESLVIQGDGVCKRCEKVQKGDVVGIVRYVIRPTGKQISTHSYSSRVYWQCWLFFRPLRRYLLVIYDRRLPMRFLTWRKSASSTSSTFH